MSPRTVVLLILALLMAACSEEAPSLISEPPGAEIAACLTSPLPTVDLAAVPDHVIAATATDPLIIGEPTKEHRVYLPPAAVAVRDELLVFLGGSGGEPAQHEDLLRIWAHAGYRSISLAYMNEEPAGGLCATVLDEDCEEEVREETIYGDVTHDSIYTTVSEPDSIVYRLRRLLQHLDRHRPAAGFGVYLDANGGIRWDQIVLGGFSQGGGHVGLLSRDFLVARAFFLSKAVGHSTNAAGVTDISPWVHDARATPADRLYGIVHEDEDAWSYTPQVSLRRTAARTSYRRPSPRRAARSSTTPPCRTTPAWRATRRPACRA
jgi:hypothetical protein